MTREWVGLAGAAALLAAACGRQVLPTATPPTFATPSATPAPTPERESLPTPTPRPTLMAQPGYCVPAEKGLPQDIVGTPASPYLVRQPMTDARDAPTVVFLGGGSGSRRSAERAWANYLSEGRGVDDFRIILPYSTGVEFYDYYEARRTYLVVDEVLACYGGDPSRVHLAGFSNGGHVAFELMLEHPERFATLLGAPGEFPQASSPEQWAKALGGHAVFNGVGELDDDWKPGVRAAHEGLVKVGIPSVYVEFKGQRHSLSAAFDETVFFDFWRTGGTAAPTDGAQTPPGR